MPRRRVSVVPSLPVTETVTSTPSTLSFPLLHRRHFHFFPHISLSMASASTDQNVDLEAQRGVQHASRASSALLGSSYYFRSVNIPRERGGRKWGDAISINLSQSEMEDDSSFVIADVYRPRHQLQCGASYPTE